MDQRRRPSPRTAFRTTVGKPVMMMILRGSRVSRKQCALTDAKSTTAPRVTIFTTPWGGDRTSCLLLPDGVEPAKVGSRPDLVDYTRHTWRMTRIPAAMAGLALVAVTAVACGSDDGDDSTASDSSHVERPGARRLRLGQPRVRRPHRAPPTTTSATRCPRRSSTRRSRPPSPTASRRWCPPACRRAGPSCPAAYEPKGGGMWRIDLTDPNGADGHPDAVDRVGGRPGCAAAPRRGSPAGTVKLSNRHRQVDRLHRHRAAALAKELSEHRGGRGRPGPGHGQSTWPRSCSPPRTPATATAG